MGQRHWEQRQSRLQQALGQAEIRRGTAVAECTKLIALTSSRLGHDIELQEHVCQFLNFSLMECRRRESELLIAIGSAIEPWVRRAAELFGVPLRTLSCDAKTPADILVHPPADSRADCRDAAVIAVAEQVDCAYVRRGGTIEKCLLRRAKQLQDASTRVACSHTKKCAAARLIQNGAIGWFRPRLEPLASSTQEKIDLSRCQDDWIRAEDEWLVHCTRQRVGPWPGETRRQYQDAILLGHPAAMQRRPVDALARIIRNRRLIAGAIATRHARPVVCFSAVALNELLQRRCFRPQLGRWDYEPFGVAIRITAAQRIGIVPVIYGDDEIRTQLAAEEQFRFHPQGTTYDWRQEREWRSNISVDLNSLNSDDVRVFAIDNARSRSSLQDCPWPMTWIPIEQQESKSSLTTTGKPV